MEIIKKLKSENKELHFVNKWLFVSERRRNFKTTHVADGFCGSLGFLPRYVNENIRYLRISDWYVNFLLSTDYQGIYRSTLENG